MFNTLYSKLVAVLVAFAVLIVVMTVMVIRFSQEAYEMEMQQRLYRELAQELAQENVLLEGRKINITALQAVRERLSPFNTAIDVYYLDSNGRVLASSNPVETLKLLRVETQPLQLCLETADNLPILGDDPSDPKSKKIFSVAKLSEGKQGYLYVTLNDASENTRSFTKQLMKTYTVRQGMWLITGGLLLALLAGLLLISLITRPLRRLSRAMDNFHSGGFSKKPQPVALPSENDEIGRLSTAFNQMAQRINTQMHELERNDQQRREMLANVSHDLRTPLASLQGYLETLLMKKQSLSAEEKRSYLEIAAQQSARLSKLVRKLFELSKLESTNADIAPEQFALPELAQDVVQKFDLAASKKQVTLKTQFNGTLPLVYADIGLIERVLENLIENALRYTQAGGSIVVNLASSLDHVTVEVSDTGCGIEAQHLERIFDRFYRTEKSRHDASDSAGLGLAIVKRILELHHTEITVNSAPGQGTTFSFQLPLADSLVKQSPLN